MNLPTGEKPSDASGQAKILAFCGQELLVIQNGRGVPVIPTASNLTALSPFLSHRWIIGASGQTAFQAAHLHKDAVLPEGCSLGGLRGFFGVLDETEFAAAGRAMHLLNWDANHRFCGKCGARNQDKADELALICPACGLEQYPRVSPAIIVAVTCGDRLLLAARTASYGFHQMFSVLAGYAEPGETLEECVRREVREEVGIGVDHIRYFGSQPWPFSGSLMVGFSARYAGGELQPDQKEIRVADWFSADALPKIPGKISIARQLIDAFAQGKLKE